MFSKILIANRGEIACRVIRTARRMGIATVAVYSDADAGAVHVEMADEAYRLGPAPARDSYLRGDKIVEVALRCGAEAIHPGYGFLAENAGFAEACAAAGVVFVGPSASAIRAMGGKSQAKALMERAGVPLVPGYHGEDQEAQALLSAARRIGWPVLIKASAGGGGKGMRIVEEASAFADQLAGAKREAAAAFGDDHVLIEKYVTQPRHVEIQVFADRHGECLYLFERDCSIQRRHQKVVEEAPAPGLSEELRRRMGEAAVAAAKAIGYEGAGTVEFLLDREGAFYFMEMNTRLQVEHPVTEFITGLDLVEWQFRVAAGEPLPKRQQELRIAGHAIEVRLYAEDAERDFLPATGQVEHLRFPPADPNVRVDSGVRAGDRIAVHYDPMIAKLIVWGEDRAAALRHLREALAGTEVAGLTTNLSFLSAVAAHPAFAAGEIDTGFIARHRQALAPATNAASETVLALACLGVLLERQAEAERQAARSLDPYSPWALRDGWRLNDDARDTLTFRERERELTVPLIYRREGYDFVFASGTTHAAGRLDADGRLSARIGDSDRKAGYFRSGNEVWLFAEGVVHRLLLVDPLPSEFPEAQAGGLTAPMPGVVTALLAKAGDKVAKGAALLVMEAMKMEHTLKAPAEGRVERFPYPVGALVEEGTVLIDFVPEEA